MIRQSNNNTLPRLTKRGVTRAESLRVAPGGAQILFREAPTACYSKILIPPVKSIILTKQMIQVSIGSELTFQNVSFESPEQTPAGMTGKSVSFVVCLFYHLRMSKNLNSTTIPSVR